MVGDVVGGYEVKEALASGRTGLLFLAVHASGHRAVVRRRVAEDDPQEFAREVAQVLALPALPMVELRKSRAGEAVMLAIVDPNAPGTGYTDHTNTVPLPRVSPKPAPKKRALLMLIAALLGMVGAIAFLSARSGPVEVAPAPVAPAPAEVLVAPPRSPLDPAPVVVKPAVEVAPAPAPPSAEEKEPAKVLVAGVRSCTPDDAWKKNRYADIQDLFRLALRTDALSRAWDPSLNELEREVHRATTARDCVAIEDQLQRCLKKIEASSPP